IVGAGPTGLFLALVLSRLGIRVRIIDETGAPGTTSRALAMQARTLEFYRQLDIADDVVRRALRLDTVNLWRRGVHAAQVELGAIGQGLSPFPFALIFPQDEHESLLIEKLLALGVTVERRTTLIGLEERPQSVVVREQSGDGAIATCEANYVAGCDGARSLIRRTIGAEFPGGTYEHLFYVADVQARGARMNHELHVMLDEAGFLALFPLLGEGRGRLIGTVRADAVGESELRWEHIDRRPLERIGLEIEQVHWFSTYRVHHRVADRFRRGRVFLLGDAAHIHSPVGGQGMNTGLGDAMNLAWKLAAVLDDRANSDLLDSYEPERIAFARRLVQTTDRVFQAASSESRVAKVVRTGLVPAVVSRVFRTSLGRRFFFRMLSQTGIEYRSSAWSGGEALGAVRAGDRLPWVEPARPDQPDNFTPLRSLDWQVHVYGTPSLDLRSRCSVHQLPLHAFAFDAHAKAAELHDDAVYLVRPDGYLGAVFPASTATGELEEYLAAHGVRTRSANPAG
ncbi:MAG TPA: FAD-dependent monooxygenase, partial [Polyangiaceae bacterium]